MKKDNKREDIFWWYRFVGSLTVIVWVAGGVI